MLWNVKAKKVIKDKGQFVCPQCGEQALYTRINISYYRFLLFFALYPVQEAVDYVECGACQKHFHTSSNLQLGVV